MHAPLTDTIVAVSSAWEPSAVGIVRLSGPQALELAAGVGAVVPTPRNANGFTQTHIRFDAGGEALTLPALALWFREGHSYTGQPLVELHTVGSLPALRALCDALIAAGARRALPGEFTARAYLNGRLSAEQVDGVLGLIHAGGAGAARAAARLVRGQRRAGLEQVSERLTDLIARIEAGIDFADEEGVRFITPAQVCEEIDRIIAVLERLAAGRPAAASRPHVALAGLPNAGKSTLLNALAGRRRAIVSPVIGTTRDVVSVDVTIDGRTVVLQDCAGLGDSADELDLAGRLAAERAADLADLVLWVHDCSQPWTARERAAWERLDGSRRLLVYSKADQPALATGAGRPGTAGVQEAEPSGGAAAPPVGGVLVCAPRGEGLDALHRQIGAHLERAEGGGGGSGVLAGSVATIRASLKKAREIAQNSIQNENLLEPELVALELRAAWERIEGVQRGPLVEEALGRIYATFCLGK